MAAVTLTILMVEDDDADVLLMQRALEQGAAGHTLHLVGDGEDAVSYLRGQGQYANRAKFPLPNIILTDLKMPRLSGFDLLRWLNQHPECSVIPIIVFTGSAEPSDIKLAYELGANSYMVKPSQLDDLMSLIRIIYEYWCRCERPARPSGC